jgi:hypothetical protein
MPEERNENLVSSVQPGEYALMFNANQIGEPIIEATRELMTKIWRQPKEVRIEGINRFIDVVSEYYGVSDNKPRFEIIRGSLGRQMYKITGGGQYNPQNNTIILYKKFSLVTFLHEYRHALQHLTGNILGERDARGWSVSLFFLADPDRYFRAVQNGWLHFN